MVAVVSGSGLGLSTSTRSGGESQIGRGNEGVFVNTRNGNLLIQGLDENVAALGLDLALVRTYNSQGQTDDDNNDGWRFGTNQRVHGPIGPINTEGSTIKKVSGDGSEVIYTYRTAFLAYVATDGDGAHDTLELAGSVWTWTDGSTRTRATSMRAATTRRRIPGARRSRSIPTAPRTATARPSCRSTTMAMRWRCGIATRVPVMRCMRAAMTS